MRPGASRAHGPAVGSVRSRANAATSASATARCGAAAAPPAGPSAPGARRRAAGIGASAWARRARARRPGRAAPPTSAWPARAARPPARPRRCTCSTKGWASRWRSISGPAERYPAVPDQPRAIPRLRRSNGGPEPRPRSESISGRLVNRMIGRKMLLSASLMASAGCRAR